MREAALLSGVGGAAASAESLTNTRPGKSDGSASLLCQRVSVPLLLLHPARPDARRCVWSALVALLLPGPEDEDSQGWGRSASSGRFCGRLSERVSGQNARSADDVVAGRKSISMTMKGRAPVAYM